MCLPVYVQALGSSSENHHLFHHPSHNSIRNVFMHVNVKLYIRSHNNQKNDNLQQSLAK